MKTKTINKIITSKFNQWVKTITDDSVRQLVEKNTIMTGGAIASMLLNEDVNDFDFYFRNKETTLAVAKYYVAQFLKDKEAMKTAQDTKDLVGEAAADIITETAEVESVPENDNTGITVPISVREEGDRIKIVAKSAGISSVEDGENSYQYFEMSGVPMRDAGGNYIEGLVDISNQLRKNSEKKFKPVFLSSNAITLTDQVQIVIRFYGEPSVIHENYDFAHCRNYWTSWDNDVHLDPKALECLLTKELVYIGSKYPLASVCRIRKFIKRGWHINAGQLLKILMQLSELNLKDFKVLEEQLTGVDMAYFHEILAKLRSTDPSAVNVSYLTTLIDELF